MKTTNKLLIGLAIALFILPLGVMVIWANSNRVSLSDYQLTQALETEEFNTTDVYFVSKKEKSFGSITISSRENAYLSIYLVKSADYGYKLDKGLEDKFESEVNSDGKLMINTKDGIPYFQGSIYIFAPNFHDLELSTMQIGELGFDVDSIKLTLDGVQLVRNLKKETKANNVHLVLRSSNIDFALNNLDNLDLDMENSSISLGTGTYNRIVANLDNSSIIPIGDRKGLFIKDLMINTIGKSTLGFFQKEEIGKITGSLSDSSTVLMPVYVYKNLLIK